MCLGDCRGLCRVPSSEAVAGYLLLMPPSSRMETMSSSPTSLLYPPGVFPTCAQWTASHVAIMQSISVQLNTSDTYPFSWFPCFAMVRFLVEGPNALTEEKITVHLYPENWYHQATGRNPGEAPTAKPRAASIKDTVCLKPAYCAIRQHEVC